MIAMLIYPPYRSSLRSFSLSTTKTGLQQNTRVAIKRIVKELGAGMIVIPKESNNYGYADSSPYKIAVRLPDFAKSDKIGDIVALYAAFPDDSSTPIDPVSASEGKRPFIYLRRYDSDTSKWEEPDPLIHQEKEMKVTQLNFILGEDNQDRVLITLELAQKEQTTKEWRTYKLVSRAKLGAR
jgi:hypothetical protein